MEEFIDRSLKNLNIECIDLVQLHCPPLEILKKETFESMDHLSKRENITLRSKRSYY